MDATMYRMLSYFLLVSNIVAGYPEEGKRSFKLEGKEAVVYFSAIRRSAAKLFLKLECESDFDIKVNWILISSKCFNDVYDLNATMLFTNSSLLPLHPEHEDKVSKSEHQISGQCQNQNVGEYIGGQSLLTTSIDGSHFLAVKFICTQCAFVNTTATIEWFDTWGGYASAAEFPLLPFHVTLSTTYFFILLSWVVLERQRRSTTSSIHIFITGLLVLLLLEHLAWSFVYHEVHSTGHAGRSPVLTAELLSCVERTLKRILVLVLCLGYGVSKQYLGQTWRLRCVAIGFAYFILVSVDGFARQAWQTSPIAYQVHMGWVIASQLPLVVCDLLIAWWIFIHLAETLRESRVRRATGRYRVYYIFGYILALGAFIALLFAIWSLEVFRLQTCVSHLSFIWASVMFWPLLSFGLICSIVILWRPRKQSHGFAYSALFDAADDEADHEARITIVRSPSDDDQNSSNTPYASSEAKHLAEAPDKSIGNFPDAATLFECAGLEAGSGPNEKPPVYKLD